MLRIRAVSPVIATVILVAVATTVSIAVAFWMGGIAGQYTKFESIEVQSAACSKVMNNDTYGTYWLVQVTLKNSGSADATLNGAYVNDIPVNIYNQNHNSATKTATSMSTQATIHVGQSVNINVYVDSGYPYGAPYSSGTTVNVKFLSAGGFDYIKVITLT